MATTRITKETLYLRHDFTDGERLQMGDDLAQAHNRMASIEEEEAVMKAQIKDRKTSVEQTIGTLYRNLNNRFEMRNIACSIAYDQPNVGEVSYMDPDGAVAKVRPMTEAERQMDLPLDQPIVVVPLEKSAENIEHFFVSQTLAVEDFVAEALAACEVTEVPPAPISEPEPEPEPAPEPKKPKQPRGFTKPTNSSPW
jgi:hypothetical protein